MIASVEARLRRLEDAEEARELGRWAQLFAETFGVAVEEARDALSLATAAVERCAGVGDAAVRAVCIGTELGLHTDPANLLARRNQWSALRAAGLTDEEILRSRAAEEPRTEAQRVGS